MRLHNILLSAITCAALSSCSVIYEDLDPCPHGVDLTLSYTKNMNGVDDYANSVHCAKLLIYDSDGRFFGEYEPDGAYACIELPDGQYKIIAYGGMWCEEADFDFSHSLVAGSHHYNELETFIKGTRAPESAKQLHSQFHGMTTLTVAPDDTDHRKAAIDLTHNINNVSVLLSYSDTSEVKADDFNVYISADNAVFDHANNPRLQGSDIIYRPYAENVIPDGQTVGGDPAPETSFDLSIGRLTTDSNATLHIVRKSDGKEVYTANLVDYFSRVMAYDAAEMKNLQDYLDRRDHWTMEYTLNRETDLLFGISIKINGWTIILNNFDL